MAITINSMAQLAEAKASIATYTSGLLVSGQWGSAEIDDNFKLKIVDGGGNGFIKVGKVGIKDLYTLIQKVSSEL